MIKTILINLKVEHLTTKVKRVKDMEEKNYLEVDVDCPVLNRRGKVLVGEMVLVDEMVVLLNFENRNKI